MALDLALRVPAAVDLQAGVLAGLGGRLAHHGRHALAAERAGRVDAERVVAAGATGGALVHVHAGGALGGEAPPARAHALGGDALGVVGTIEVRVAAGADLRGLARKAAVALVACGAGAVVAGRLVDADGADAAAVQAPGGALVHVHAACAAARRAGEALGARAEAGAAVGGARAQRVRAARLAVAAAAN